MCDMYLEYSTIALIKTEISCHFEITSNVILIISSFQLCSVARTLVLLLFYSCLIKSTKWYAVAVSLFLSYSLSFHAFNIFFIQLLHLLSILFLLVNNVCKHNISADKSFSSFKRMGKTFFSRSFNKEKILKFVRQILIHCKSNIKCFLFFILVS